MFNHCHDIGGKHPVDWILLTEHLTLGNADMSQIILSISSSSLLLLLIVAAALVAFVVTVLYHIPRRKREFFSSQNVFQDVTIILCCGLALWLGADGH